MPLFSLIVPVYNCEAYLVECIQSIINQSFDDWELILIDDGSKDNSLKICNQYESEKVKVFHQSNQGVSLARKKGVSLAVGKYISFVDSDDWLEANCLETVYSIIKKYNPQIVSFSYYIDKPNGEMLAYNTEYVGNYDKSEIEKAIFPKLIHGPNADYYRPRLWGNAFNADLIRPYMIADSLAEIGEDSACVIPAVFHATSIYYLPDCLYHYRDNAKSVTRSLKVYNWENPRIVANHLANSIDLKQFDFEQQLFRRVSHDLFNVCITQFYSNNSINHVANSIKTHLNDPLYQDAINEAVFRGSIKARLMMFALKHKVVVLLYCYSLFKRFHAWS